MLAEYGDLDYSIMTETIYAYEDIIGSSDGESLDGESSSQYWSIYPSSNEEPYQGSNMIGERGSISNLHSLKPVVIESGQNLLHKACMASVPNPISISRLVTTKNLNMKDRSGRLAIHLLCLNPGVTPDSLTALLTEAQPAYKSYTDELGFTAFHYLASNPSISVELIRAYKPGPIKYITNGFRETPFHLLSRNPFITPNVLREFMTIVSKTSMDNKGNLPIHYLASNRNLTLELFIMMYDRHSMDVKNIHHETPMHILAKNPIVTYEMLRRLPPGFRTIKDGFGLSAYDYVGHNVGLDPDLRGLLDNP